MKYLIYFLTCQMKLEFQVERHFEVEMLYVKKDTHRENFVLITKLIWLTVFGDSY